MRRLLLPGNPFAALPAVVAAGTLAIWSLNFGLPFLFRPDEDVLVGRAVHIAVSGSLDPHFYNWPPLTFLVFALAEWLMRTFHIGALGAADKVDPTAAYLAARAVSAGAMALATGWIFYAGRRAYGIPAAMMGALLFATAPLVVRQAHFATPDALQTALVAASLSAAVAAGRQSGFWLAGLLAGLAAATKYTGGLIILAPLILAWGREDRVRVWALTVLGAAIGFVLPFLLVGHAGDYLDGFRFLSRRAATAYDRPIGLIYHPTRTLPFGLGLGSFAAALAGVGAALVRRRLIDLALLAVVLAELGANATTHEVFFRYLLPAFPALALLAGGALAAVPRSRLGLAVALFAVLLLPSIYASFETDLLLGTPDTRLLAAQSLLRTEPASTRVEQRGSYFMQVFYGPEQVRLGNPLHRLYYTGDPVIDSFQQGRFTARLPTVREGGDVIVIESLPPWWHSAVVDPGDSFYLPIWGFGDVTRPGPAIKIEH